MALPGVYKMFNDRWCNQTVWIISDTHFGDKDLRAGMPNRPSDEELVRRINAKVGRKDTLIILGDVGNIKCVRELRAAHKVLIMGNHDSGTTNYKREIVKRIFDRDIHPDKAEVRSLVEAEFPGWRITIEEEYDFHCPFNRWIAYADNCLFDEVYEGALVIGEKLLLSHEPIQTGWAVNLHGHDHAGAKRKGCYNFCADVIGYEPVNLNQFLKSGIYKDVESIHRMTIDKATERKKKRGGKKYGKM